MANTHIVAVVCTILIVSPGLALAESTVVTGSVTSVAAFAQLQANIRGRVPAGKQADFASCVCKKDRGKLVYAYSLESSDNNNLINDCRKVAAACGGCYKPPAFSKLNSQADMDRAQQTRRIKRGYSTVFGESERAPDRPVREIPDPPDNNP